MLRLALRNEVDELDQVFNTVNKLFTPQAHNDIGRLAATDIFENDAAYFITMDLPGIKLEDIDIEYDDGTLLVTAIRNRVEEQEGKFHRTERPLGEIKRRFKIPRGVEQDKIEANLNLGVLELALPKAEAAKPFRIQVQANQEATKETEA